MSYTTHIDKTDELLHELREAYGHDEVQRFLAGLSQGRIRTEEQVIEFTNYVRKSDGLTRLELSRLRRLEAEGFIEQFATNQNKIYNTTELLMGKMRSGVSRAMKVLKEFCPRKRSRGDSRKKRHVMNHSKIGNGPYSLSLWKLEQYPETVAQLYGEIRQFSEDLTECIDLCTRMIALVETIRSNPMEAYRIERENRKEALLNNHHVVKRFIEMNVDFESKVMKQVEELRRQKKTMEEICAILYHTLDNREYIDWKICEAMMAARRNDITNEEYAIWGDDKQQVMRCRLAYSHLDELELYGFKVCRHDDKLDGMLLAMLYKLSKTQCGLQCWHTYFCKSYLNGGGKHTPTKRGAIQAALAKISQEKVSSEVLTMFDKAIECIISKYSKEKTLVSESKQLTSETKEEMRQVVNF